ncbi:M14 family zinc carboxypeptidase [Thermopolyspora sp. NPDC052614]|uniref:M14 family metallopeptidase n=1 Tax=Thermopolyspora sp. NPDC052614 TaxID=3155682 RepID=UPI00343A88B2
MKRRKWLVTAAAAVLLGAAAAQPAAAVPRPPATEDGTFVYTGELDARQLAALIAAGVDREEVRISGGRRDRFSVEVILGSALAERLKSSGVNLTRQQAASTSARTAAKGDGVFKPYSGADGLRERIEAAANAKPDLAKVVTIGKTHKGQDIIAVKVTKDARTTPDGSRKAMLYIAAQHAREWITPETVRRLINHYLDGYATNAEIRQIVDTTELWFVPVSNPDGYDYTFAEDRLWRKNLRDNDGDGEITSADGVDPNRNFAYKWGYDEEGSSSNPFSETYRGPSPQSEPETQAMDGLVKKIKPVYMINYHSAAELLLYGVGWQQATPTPDDLIFEAMLGDDAHPAVPGYDPDIGAELYTTNGETDGHVTKAYGTMAITPEMSTCETAAQSVPDDEWTLADCAGGLGFTFPDSEPLIQAEFAKNIPLALAAAKSVHTPDKPVSVVGRTVPDFQVDKFDVSYGDTQQVAVVARRSLPDKRMWYRINGGEPDERKVREWRGGDRYGDEGDIYFAEYRAEVRGAKPGDEVEVWFSSGKQGRPGYLESEHFTYTRADDKGAEVLVLANEDYTGFNPGTPGSVTAPKYAEQYQQALDAAGYDSLVWDVDKQGVPHHLGVLNHFKAVVWYLGDNRLSQEQQDVATDTYLFGPLPDLDVRRSQQDLTIAVRDYLNEGGKLLHTGETTAYYGLLGATLGGIYYGLDGDPDADCVVTADFFSDCLLLADDFTQYYLGVYGRTPREGPTGFTGAGALGGESATFGGPAVADNPLDEAGTLQVTSDVLPKKDFPQFKSWAAGDYQGATGPFDPVQGSWFMAGRHADDSYMRLTRTIDLSSVTAAQQPKLEFQLSFDTEPGYDNIIVEAHTVGQDDWTTLPDANGGSDTTVPTECEADFLLDEHPWLLRYLTPGNPCTATGTSGSWNRFTGNSGGWKQVAVDLSAYAGKQVEVSISYVTDPATGGVGAFIDDTKLTTTGGTSNAEGFESGLGAWSTPGPPAGSPTGGGDFVRDQADTTAAVSTEDTVLLGFGLEQVDGAAERADVIKKAMKHLIG